MNGTPIIKRLFQGIDNEGGIRRPADVPTGDTQCNRQHRSPQAAIATRPCERHRPGSSPRRHGGSRSSGLYRGERGLKVDPRPLAWRCSHNKSMGQSVELCKSARPQTPLDVLRRRQSSLQWTPKLFGSLRLGKISRRLTQDLVDPTKLKVLPFQGRHLLGHLRRNASPGTTINLGLHNLFVQRVRRAVDLRYY